VQQAQLNYQKLIAAAGMVFAVFCGVFPAKAGTAAGDSILDGGPPGPCNPQTDSADYVGGTDVNGHPVASADLDRQPVPVPGQMLIPLKAPPGRDPAYVQADGKKLDALLNPPPTCPVRKTR
jgi:hypothetical protein